MEILHDSIIVKKNMDKSFERYANEKLDPIFLFLTDAFYFDIRDHKFTQPSFFQITSNKSIYCKD